MKYIVDSILKTVISTVKSSSDEVMIKIDGFEDIRVYVEVANALTESFKNENKTIKIKLAKSKWNYFKKIFNNSTSDLNQMEQNGWVADEQSITYYRNMHDTDILILMGTEDEEDKGGLSNFYTITPDGIINKLGEDYYAVYGNDLIFDASEKLCVNKIYKDLFEFVPLDICKLSDIADHDSVNITVISDFIRCFYAQLPKWGLPMRRDELPTKKQIQAKGNILREEYRFVKRTDYKNINGVKYSKICERLKEYESEGGKYNSEWEEWSEQEISSYSEFKEILLSYIRGEDIAECKKRLIKVDYNIIEDIFDIKKEATKRDKASIPKVTGEPLFAFLNAYMQVFREILDNVYANKNLNITGIRTKIKAAEIVCEELDIDKENENLKHVWENICCHTNGVFDYINKEIWTISNEEIEIESVCENADFFDVKNSTEKIEAGLVVAAGSNKKINTIDFVISCVNEDGDTINLNNRKGPIAFQWKFTNVDSWLYDFEDICNEIQQNESDKFIPLAVMNDMKPLIFAKSTEEFFDLYEERTLKFSNICEYIDEHTDKNHKMDSVMFDTLGKKFVEMISDICKNGFYCSIAGNSESKVIQFTEEYKKLGEYLTENTFSENMRWILDCYIHAFNIEESEITVYEEEDSKCCIVPPWHPALLEKLVDQKRFILDGCQEWLKKVEKKFSKSESDEMLNSLIQMSMIQSALDIFPSNSTQYYGAIASFGEFSTYGRSDIEIDRRLKDMIHKDAIYDDDYNEKENIKMSDNAKMIYDVLEDYIKTFPKAYSCFSLVFIEPSDLQPIVAAVHNYIEKEKSSDKNIDIIIKILVRPENKGGRNYLAYWMDESFSQDDNVKIKVYMNEWNDKKNINDMLDGNNDIVFVMDLMKTNNLQFVKTPETKGIDIVECRFPIVLKPTPVSSAAKNTKRKIEISQPQFRCSYAHTQVVRYRNNTDDKPQSQYIAVKEVGVDKDIYNMVDSLHDKAYWVVCIDSGMDGAILNKQDSNNYTIIGFSTGKGAYGQYNITITTRKRMIVEITRLLIRRLEMLFQWDVEVTTAAVRRCLEEAMKLDGISFFSAINQKDSNVREFMAYVLTSMLIAEETKNSGLKTIVHLDSYKHWFTSDEAGENNSRPDFLVVEVEDTDEEGLLLKATVVECKIAERQYAGSHKEKAKKQVRHGEELLSKLFDPDSKSIKRRYWYAQLYRALAYAQITFSDDTNDYNELAQKLRLILDGKFRIEWQKRIIGYWINGLGDEDINTVEDEDCINITEIPQKRIKQLLLQRRMEEIEYKQSEVIFDEEDEKKVDEIEKELKEDLDYMQNDKMHVSYITNSDEDMQIKEDTRALYSGDKESEPKKPQVTINTLDNVVIKEPENNTTESSVLENSNVTERLEKKKIEDIRILIGNDKANNTVYWEFGNKDLANRHMLITGVSGYGKTYAIQTMLYELSKGGVSSIIFDYTEGFRMNQLEAPFVEQMQDKLSQHVIKMQGVPINPFKRNELELDGIKGIEEAADVALRFANILQHVYKFGDQQTSAVFEATRIGIEKYGNNMNMAHFMEELDEVGKDNKTAASVKNKMNPFFYSIKFSDSNNFDWGKILYSDEPITKIFQLSQIDKSMQLIVIELMLWDLWYYSKQFGKKEKPFVVVLDEAQNLSHKSNAPSAAILTEGRKFGWSAWFATQSLKVLADDEVVRLLQSAFKLYFKPTEDEVIKMAKQLNPTDVSEWLAPLNALKKGQCIVVGDRIRNDGSFGRVNPTVTNITSFDKRR